MEKARLIDEAVNELRTVRDILRWGASQFQAAQLFYGHGTDNAWDEAVALLLHALDLPHTINPQISTARLTRRERQKVAELFLRRIAERKPVPYLTNEAWFAGLPFYVDERVLIPRSPLAELIAQQFSPWIVGEKVNHILDLCTGSGCIAIACAQAFPDAQVDAIDICLDALTVAKMNTERHQVTEQVRLIQSDLFSVLKDEKYDVIVSNPPYVTEAEMIALPPEYHHEPTLGLAAGESGLDIVEHILRSAGNYLNPQGILIVEVGNSYQNLIERFPKIPFTWLEFQNGESEVFLLTAEQIKEYF